MRIKVTEEKVYKYNELSEEQKEKVLNNLCDIGVDYDWWECDCMTGFTSKEMKECRLPDLLTYKDMYFSIDRAWYIQFTDCSFADSEVARKYLKVPKKLWNNTYFSFENRHYSGSSNGTTKLIYEPQDNYAKFTPKQLEILERAADRFNDKMEECLKNLRDDYEYRTSRKGIEKMIEMNDYEFTEEGRIA